MSPISMSEWKKQEKSNEQQRWTMTDKKWFYMILYDMCDICLNCTFHANKMLSMSCWEKNEFDMWWEIFQFCSSYEENA